MSSGFKPLVNGLPALLSFTISRLPLSSFTNQTQPEPNNVAPALLNSVLNASKEPHFFSMAVLTLTLASQPVV